MDIVLLRALEQDTLTAYLWCRLRLEAPLDPPLDARTLEAPEEFLIRAVRQNDDPAFRGRVAEAIRQNIAKLLRSLAAGPVDEIMREQLASLAFLSTAIKAEELGETFFFITQSMIVGLDKEWGVALPRCLQATIFLAKGKYREFWREMTDHTHPTIREAAYLGLVRADRSEGLAKLPRILRDTECDRSTLLYSMAKGIPGIQALSEVAKKDLQEGDRQILIDVLSAAGAEEDLIGPLRKPQGRFNFKKNDPRDYSYARSRPLWHPEYGGDC